MSLHHTDSLDSLFSAIVSLRSVQECYMFFEDLCTVRELLSIAQRLEVARILSSGKKYSDVSLETGASTATISRVNRCLQYGSGGYKLVLDREAEASGEAT